jgi:HSP20 family molecular chaperone IbpA
MKNKPELHVNEEVILASSGAYKDSLRSGWKLSNLYLTNQRLFLWNSTKTLLQIPLENITGINVQLKNFILRRKNALCISYQNLSNKSLFQVWIMVKDVHKLKNKIYERSLLKIDQEGIDKIIKELDAESQSILLFVWENKHAAINELFSLYNAPNHMEVLNRIRNIINPVSEKVIGFPVLVFERSKIDESIGEKVLFSWWVIGGGKLKEEREETLLDIFDEGDYLNVIIELKAAQEKDILLRVDENILTVSCKTSEAKYYEQVFLPSKIDKKSVIRKYHNNILEVRLQKLKNEKQGLEVRH